MPATTAPRATIGLRSKRLLALAGDERLVAQIRAGSELAFEVAFERHGAAILGFCRHMLGSHAEAEDAVQHTFAAAYRALLEDERPIRLKPWLFAIARNRCLTVLRDRREHAGDLHEIPTEGLADQVQRRSDLRELLADVRDLPDEQRSALLLAELGGLSHSEVADVIGCKPARVKALVFRARSGLIERRDARAAPCNAIREQLANLRGGSLRRSELRHHLRVCAGCREYREQVRRQRAQLAVALPVVPSAGLKSGVLGALGIGAGSAGGGGAMVGAAAVAPIASTAAKVACVAIVAGGGALGGQAALSQPEVMRTPAAPPLKADAVPGAESAEAAAPAPVRRGTKSRRDGARAERARRHARGHSKGDRAKRAGRGGAAGPERAGRANGRPAAPGRATKWDTQKPAGRHVAAAKPRQALPPPAPTARIKATGRRGAIPAAGDLSDAHK